ncbi:MurR/RpiR family transcriptional regulator [Meridianimarinicoccus sp. MJW13]|uniref:MurR/RpiR family transcriptional regulator n=1 Tax=Meridianimarinicoccus sp. MJW13 TaxID=2720031 RepID=UPI001868CBCB|nr:MurR/RpiR family transcriptional regulator [Fluviibacterium sp. MJW13]
MHSTQASQPIVKDILQARHATLTLAERQVVSALLQDYPVAGLQSITELADTAKVSSPTVVRLARKLGFDGFTGLQDALRREISEQIRKPASKLDRAQRDHGDSHTLFRFAEAAVRNLQGTLDRIDTEAFDTVATLLADTDRPVYLEGGRITRSVADHLYNHLQIIRPGVTTLGRVPAVWPQYLLDMDAAAILILFDIRRYESDLSKLARLGRESGATLVLFTDQWNSPIARHADHVFSTMVEAPSGWDSTLSLQLLVEALVAQVQTRLPNQGRDRIERLESMFTETRLFRDFN